MLYTTLALVQGFSRKSYLRVMDGVGKEYGEDSPIPLNVILDFKPNGFEIAIHCLRYAVIDKSLEDSRRISWCLAADYLEYLPVSFWGQRVCDAQKAISVMRRCAFKKATEQEVQTAWEDAHEWIDPFGCQFDLDWAFFITGLYVFDVGDGWKRCRFLSYLSEEVSRNSFS